MSCFLHLIDGLRFADAFFLDLEDSELVRERQLDIEQALQEMDEEDMF
jgi:hypothetical protein